MEAVTNPLHEAAKRGNQDFLTECLRNRVMLNPLKFLQIIKQKILA